MIKKISILLLLVVLLTPVFASTVDLSITLSLDENAETLKIQKFGISKEVPSFTGATSPAEEKTFAIPISEDATESQTIPDTTFYIWWYLYSTEKYSVACSVTDFISSDSGASSIPFEAVPQANDSGVNQTLSKGEAIPNILKSDYDPYAGLYANYIPFTISGFDYTDYAIKDYTATITLTISTNG